MAKQQQRPGPVFSKNSPTESQYHDRKKPWYHQPRIIKTQTRYTERCGGFIACRRVGKKGKKVRRTRESVRAGRKTRYSARKHQRKKALTSKAGGDGVCIEARRSLYCRATARSNQEGKRRRKGLAMSNPPDWDPHWGPPPIYQSRFPVGRGELSHIWKEEKTGRPREYCKLAASLQSCCRLA